MDDVTVYVVEDDEGYLYGPFTDYDRARAWTKEVWPTMWMRSIIIAEVHPAW